LQAPRLRRPTGRSGHSARPWLTDNAIHRAAHGIAALGGVEPSVVERAFVLPPSSRIGPLTAEERKAVIAASLVYGVYEKAEDRESAYEKLKARTEAATTGQEAPPTTAEAPSSGGFLDGLGSIFGGGSGKAPARGREGVIEAAAKSAARAIGSQVGREIIRGVLGSILGGGKRR